VCESARGRRRAFPFGTSKLSADTAEQSLLRIASQALRALLREVDRTASIAGDLARALRELRINVAG
jgi:hypothetical protein